MDGRIIQWAEGSIDFDAGVIHDQGQGLPLSERRRGKEGVVIEGVDPQTSKLPLRSIPRI